MNRIEFSDVNRFLASLGLISIGLAFFLPWFVNQNNSLLLIDQDKLEKLTPAAQKIVAKQQNTLLTINNILPIVSIGLIILGFGLLIWGIIRWTKRQTVLDKIQDEELRTKEIQNLSTKEKRDLIETEIVKTEEDLTQKTSVEEMQLEIDSYIQIENSIFLQLSENLKTRYVPTQNVRIGNFDYDIILKSKDLNSYRDRIVEIKFFKNSLTYSNIKDAATKLILACNHYQDSFKRKTLGILIIVHTEKEYDETLKKYKRDIEQYATELGKPLKANFFDREKIVTTKAAEFFK